MGVAQGSAAITSAVVAAGGCPVNQAEVTAD